MERVNNLILGGGLVGRMIHECMPDSIILEAKEEHFDKKPNFSFGTNYLWKDLPCFKTKRVKVVTRVDDEPASEASVTRYKNKIGKGHERSAQDWGLQFAPESEGFLVMAVPYANVHYGQKVVSVDLDSKWVVTQNASYKYERLFNTLPLPEFMRMAGLANAYPLETLFKFKPVFVRVVPIPPEAPLHRADVIFVNYVSNPLIEPYRYCDKYAERERHYESLTPIGFPHKRIYPGKIWDDPQVPEIRHELSQKGVFCYGRYGAWKPNELLHETYAEVVNERT